VSVNVGKARSKVQAHKGSHSPNTQRPAAALQAAAALRNSRGSSQLLAPTVHQHVTLHRQLRDQLQHQHCTWPAGGLSG